MKNLPGLATFEFQFYDIKNAKYEHVIFRLTIEKTQWILERNIDGIRVESVPFHLLYNSRGGWLIGRREQDKAETNRLIHWLERVNEKYVKC